MTYALGRSYAASARLDLQHFLWTQQCGWHVHPQIPLEEIAKKPEAKIADVGTGTGIWMIDLSERLPKTVTFEGFDISLAQAPHKSFLPPNVTCYELDGFGALPDHLIERYDIVHIRLFVHACPNGDPTPLLKNAIKMLKPGGYLMWADIDVTSGERYQAEPEARDAHQKYYAILKFLQEAHARNASSASVTPTPTWVPRLPELFRGSGLQDVISCRHPTTRAWSTVIQEIVFMTWEEISFNVLDKYPNGEGEECRALIQDAYGELRRGNAVVSDRFTVVGQKAVQRQAGPHM